MGDNRGVADRHPLLTYTLLRTLVFAVPFVLLLLVGVHPLWALVAAAFASGIVSVFLLSRQRDAVSSALTERSDRARRTMAERAAAEDSWDDAQRAGSPDREAEPEQ